jgi:hypothetical protein
LADILSFVRASLSIRKAINDPCPGSNGGSVFNHMIESLKREALNATAGSASYCCVELAQFQRLSTPVIRRQVWGVAQHLRLPDRASGATY